MPKSPLRLNRNVVIVTNDENGSGEPNAVTSHFRFLATPPGTGLPAQSFILTRKDV